MSKTAARIIFADHSPPAAPTSMSFGRAQYWRRNIGEAQAYAWVTH
jgi:hypothetical protein